jgi:two-component system, response regulator PdtaR
MPSCLIVEDEALIGMVLADAVEDAGHHVLGPIDKGSAVLDALARLNPDMAILDTQLRDGPSHEVALELRRRGVPFVVYSGHQRPKDPHPAYADAPWIEKPATPTDVLAAFRWFG